MRDLEEKARKFNQTWGARSPKRERSVRPDSLQKPASPSPSSIREGDLHESVKAMPKVGYLQDSRFTFKSIRERLPSLDQLTGFPGNRRRSVNPEQECEQSPLIKQAREEQE